MEDIGDAIAAKEGLLGTQIDGRDIRVDYSVTEKAHSPTPGEYRGNENGGGKSHSDAADYKNGGFVSVTTTFCQILVLINMGKYYLPPNFFLTISIT